MSQGNVRINMEKINKGILLDLHVHSNASDGQYTPSQLIEMASSAGLETLAITDHDTMSGLDEGMKRAEALGICFIPGIEISCQDKEEIHILGYGINRSSQELYDACNIWRLERENRGESMKQYFEILGIDIDLNKVKSYAGHGSLGRPHFARYLVEHGIVEDSKAAFDMYLDTPEFIIATDREKPSPFTAINLIHRAGGFAVLAHPGIYKNSDIGELVGRLVEVGLDGIECFYSRHTDTQKRQYIALMERYSLKTGCGSDYHGEAVKPNVRLGMEIDKIYRKDLITTLL